jgi:hypothetical protein
MQSITPPTFPARPVNGGPLEKLRRTPGHKVWEPKVNGWRAWEHAPTRAMFNRHNLPLSIAKEFEPVCTAIQTRYQAGRTPEWLDTEAFERRHNYGRGSLVLLDFVYEPMAPLAQRLADIYGLWGANDGKHAPIAKAWHFLHEPPPENALLYFAYTFTDYGIAPPTKKDWSEDEQHYAGEDVDGIYTGWRLMQAMNKKLGAEVFEGLVAKRLDSQYPVQLRSPAAEFPFWMKHRWAF